LRVILARVDEFINDFQQLLSEANRGRAGSIRDSRLLANIVTFLPTIVALRRWALPHHLPHQRLTGELVDFMLRGLDLLPAKINRVKER
jgi:hypothetical protein